ncbi:MAG: Na(+)/H(+) antiporter subunit D [Bauldia sp.]|nr:Na(+)/H(+) antiporter subunit D [Bauldia sp.]
MAGLIPFTLISAGALLSFLRGTERSAVMVGAPILTLILVTLVPEGPGPTVAWLGYELTPFRLDQLARFFAIAFSIAALAGGIFALRQERSAELAAAFVYGGATLGVVMAGDLVTLFVFWEVMAIASAIVIWSAGGSALAAGQRYILVHLLGGVLLMAGIAGHIAETGSLEFGPMVADSPARVLILLAFLINAGAPPLSAWMPDAYPESSWSGMVFLSAFTTKVALYVLLRGFAGEEILIWVGLYMTFYGIVYALLENDMRRILAYSSVNQVGIMVVGVGIGTGATLAGAAALAFAHVIFKVLLVMSAGAVLYATGKRRCTDLGGLFRTMPFTTVAAIVGALAISAFPLTSGFVSKSLITDGSAAVGLKWVFYLLTAASAGVFLHAGIKFPWFVFFAKDSGLRPPDPPTSMRVGMGLCAALCLLIGIFPGAFYALLPWQIDFHPYTADHVVSQLQLLLFSGLAFFLLLGWMKRTNTITLDLDWLWRRAGSVLAREFDLRGMSVRLALARRASKAGALILRAVYRSYGPNGILARPWPTGGMAFWTTVLLAAYLILYYF